MDESIYLGDIDTSHIKSMRLFALEIDGGFPSSFLTIKENFDGVETWNTSNIASIFEMFANCIYFNHDISKWKISSRCLTEEMFTGHFIKESFKP